MSVALYLQSTDYHLFFLYILFNLANVLQPLVLCFLCLTLSVPNFRRHLSSAFYFILTNYRWERRSYVKLKDLMSNSVDPGERAH